MADMSACISFAPTLKDTSQISESVKHLCPNSSQCRHGGHSRFLHQSTRMGKHGQLSPACIGMPMRSRSHPSERRVSGSERKEYSGLYWSRAPNSRPRGQHSTAPCVFSGKIKIMFNCWNAKKSKYTLGLNLNQQAGNILCQTPPTKPRLQAEKYILASIEWVFACKWVPTSSACVWYLSWPRLVSLVGNGVLISNKAVKLQSFIP